MKTDSDIQRDVTMELKWDPSIQWEHIGVTVSDGIVTLTGYVPSFTQRWSAEKAAERVAGVKAVADELEVKLPNASTRNDVDIAKAAANALQWNVSIPEGLQAIVDDGWVTLDGQVEWGYQREAAESAIRQLWGVRGVFNHIEVLPRAEATDIKTKIEDALQRTSAEKARNIEVKVEGGKVFLSGTVPSLEEYWVAKNAAWSAPGVTDVESDLKVAA